MIRLILKQDGPSPVSLRNLTPQMQHATSVVKATCERYGLAECVITDGHRPVAQHPTSLHPHGRALDYRTRDLADWDTKICFADDIRRDLGIEYDVVLEDDHLHVEYQPK